MSARLPAACISLLCLALYDVIETALFYGAKTALTMKIVFHFVLAAWRGIYGRFPQLASTFYKIFIKSGRWRVSPLKTTLINEALPARNPYDRPISAVSYVAHNAYRDLKCANQVNHPQILP
jgi:hypothetical protein